MTQPERRFTTFQSALLLLVLVFGFHLLMITAILPGEAFGATFSTLAAPVETLLATIGLWWASHRSAARSRQLQMAWGLLAAAHVSWLIGDILWAVLEVGLGISPFPSIADLFYILYYPLFIAGALLIPMKRLSGSGWLKLLLDMGIVALATMLIFWYFWIGPLMEMEPADFLTMALSVTYPVADFLLLAAIFVVLSRKSESQTEGPVWLLAAGIALQVCTDAVFGYQSTAGTYAGGILDMGWVGAVFLAGLAGFLHADAVTKPAASRPGGAFGSGVTESTAHWVVYLPYIWLVAVYLLLFIGSTRDVPMTLPSLITWVGVIILLVVARQVMSLRENIRLLDEQRQADRALRESEEKYRAVVEHAREGIAVTQNGVFRYLNPSAVSMTEYNRDELIGRRFLDFIAPEDVRDIRTEHELKLSGDERAFPTHYRFITKGGTILWLEGSAVLIEWDGRPALMTFVRDVTAQKRIEEDREQKSRMANRYQAALLDLAKADLSDLPTAFARITETAARTLPVQRAGIWLFDEDRTHLVLKDLFIADGGIHEANSRLDLARYRRYFAALEESRIIAADDAMTDERTAEFTGQYLVPHDIRAMLDVPIRLRGAVVGVLCHEHIGSPRQWTIEEQELAASLSDTISLALEAGERKNAEAALQESEEQYRTLFENSLDTMFTVDLEGNFTSLNQAGETLTGYRRDEMISKNFRHFLSPEVAQVVFSAYNTLFKTGKPLSGFRYSFGGKHGRQLTVEGYVTLQKKGKTVIGFQGTLKDITERLKLEQQLIQSQKMEAVGTMAGGIAHNFNNIMVGIMGYSEFLMMSKKPDDPDYKALSIIHEGTVRASELTKQMLNISRGGQFNLTAVKLNQVIERVLPLISGTLDKSIDVQMHLAPDLMAIEGDVSQIEQCLLNLCINARDAMPEGGSIIIETQNQQLDDGFVRSHIGATAGPHVVVMITDTGSGIPPEVRDHIFEPFFTTKQHQGGTGMGLATVYGIVRSHRGIISVYTEQDKGASFKLYFPVYSAVIDEIAARRRTARSMPGSTILLIDDEPVVREMWVDFLSHKGYHVITAEDGLEGIERFKSLRDGIDLVILDLIMPNLGGKETLAALREIDPMVKVLITSGYSENGQAGRIVDMGIDGFIQKPTRLTHLEEEIVRILKK